MAKVNDFRADAPYKRKSKFLLLTLKLGDIAKKFKDIEIFSTSEDKFVLGKIPKQFSVGRVFGYVRAASNATTTPTFTIELGNQTGSTVQTVGTLDFSSKGNMTVNAPFNSGKNDQFYRMEGEDLYIFASTTATFTEDDTAEAIIAIEIIDWETKEEGAKVLEPVN